MSVRRAAAVTLAYVALVAEMVALAIPWAHADTNSYLGYLGSHGVFPTWTVNADSLVGSGQRMCDILHNGGTAQDAVGSYGLPFAGPTILAAAQHELCPDTLR
jgi:hypothetical protein